MRISGTAAWWLVAMLACALAFGACGGDDDDDSSDEGATDDDTDDDTTDDDDDTSEGDDDTADDDTSDDDTGDDDTVVDPFPMPSENPSAKADAFRLFYRERNDRANLSLNRFGVGGDAGSGGGVSAVQAASDSAIAADASIRRMNSLLSLAAHKCRIAGRRGQGRVAPKEKAARTDRLWNFAMNANQRE